jgi:hypothetical protein
MAVVDTSQLQTATARTAPEARSRSWSEVGQVNVREAQQIESSEFEEQPPKL